MLVSDKFPVTPGEAIPANNDVSLSQTQKTARLAGLALLIVLAVTAYRMNVDKNIDKQSSQPIQAISANDQEVASRSPTLSVEYSSAFKESTFPDANTLRAELRVALSRYRTMRLVDDQYADYRLKLEISKPGGNLPRLYIELESTSDQSVLLARGYDLAHSEQPVVDLAVRIAAAIASPGVGAISEHLLATSRLKPIEEISQPHWLMRTDYLHP